MKSKAIGSSPKCHFCGYGVTGSMVACGDGSMKDGGRFAHPECYWRNRAGYFERLYTKAIQTVDEPVS